MTDRINTIVYNRQLIYHLIILDHIRRGFN